MNNNESHKESIKETILESIKKGDVNMRPKWHFVLRGSLFGIGIVLVVLTLLYLVSFIMFVLRENGIYLLPSFGTRGIGALFFALPWLLIFVAALFIFVLETLVRQYSFAYRRPLLYSALGAIFLVFLGAFVVAETPLHPRLLGNVRAGRHTFGGELYRQFGMPPRDIHPCMITQISESSFEAVDSNGKPYIVRITEDTRFPFGTNFAVGDRVLVMGPIVGDTVVAFGIRKIGGIGTTTPRAHIRFR